MKQDVPQEEGGRRGSFPHLTWEFNDNFTFAKISFDDFFLKAEQLKVNQSTVNVNDFAEFQNKIDRVL